MSHVVATFVAKRRAAAAMSHEGGRLNRRDALTLMAAAAAAALPIPARANPPPPMRELFARKADDAVAIGAFNEFGDGAFLFDYARGRAGRLLTRSGGGFDLAPTFDGSGAPLARIELTNAGLRYLGNDFRRIAVRREPFFVANGGVRLSGEIARRASGRPLGALVLVYGSGPAPKEALDLWAFHFLARNWAVVTYDKRGSGASTGDWRRAGLDALAQDAAAVVAHARQTPSLRSLPFGVWGASQAGWVMPQLGAEGLVDFMLMHAGAATTPGQQILDQVKAELAAYGFAPDEIAKAVAYYALDTDVSRGNAPWSAIDNAHSAAVAAKAEWLLGPPAAADAPERTFIRLVADFDPAPYWRRSKTPLLAIFGGKDVIVPVEPNQRLLKSLVPPGVRFEDIVLPRANHLCMIAETGVRAEYPKRTSIDPGYFPAIDRCLATAGKA